jgi:phosphatidylglycerophosphate synthase
VVVAALAAGLAGAAGMALALGGYGTAVALAFWLMRQGFAHPTLGLCNLVTLTRLILAASLLAPLTSDSAANWAVFAIAAVAFAMDGADGWLARRHGRVSDFGARFDMEVDAALALILALNAWAGGTATALVLLLGLPRYIFIVAGAVWPWLNAPLPDSFMRKLVCVVQIATLIALQVPVLPLWFGTSAVVLVATSLLWSFGRDCVWLWRHRA